MTLGLNLCVRATQRHSTLQRQLQDFHRQAGTCRDSWTWVTRRSSTAIT